MKSKNWNGDELFLFLPCIKVKFRCQFSLFTCLVVVTVHA